MEITDQGVGMTAADLELANQMLRTPPDFSVASLSENSRLGLFVVAQLGARHDISTKLSDSDYGGIRAIVLIPLALVALDPPAADPAMADPPPGRFPNLTGGAAADQLPITGAAATVPTISPMTTPRPGPTKHPQHYATESVQPGGSDSKPALPRRRRQTSLAPELAQQTGAGTEPAPVRPGRSAESARDLMSAIEIGTQQGRLQLSDRSPGGTDPAAKSSNEQDGEGELFPRR